MAQEKSHSKNRNDNSHKQSDAYDKSPRSPIHSKNMDYDDHAEAKGTGNENDFTTCMFCQKNNPTWTEKELDDHYFKECPLLILCPSCQQVVEIAGLPEHCLSECDGKSKYISCEVTGLAVNVNE